MYAVFDEIEQLSRVISLRMLNADFKFVFHFDRFEHPIPEYSDDFFFFQNYIKIIHSTRLKHYG